MKVVYLFNKVRTGTDQVKRIEEGVANDNAFYGMFRIRAYGIRASFIEIEHYVPLWCAQLLRKVLNIWWIHLPLYPLFFRYDIVFSSTAYGALVLHSMLCILGLRRPRWVILDFNISGTIGEAATLRQRVFKWAVAYSDGIVTISEAERETLCEIFPHLKKHIVFFHEGVDTDFYTPQITTPSQKGLILSVGLDPGRDFTTLVEAVRELPVEVRLATKPAQVAHLQPLPHNITAQLYSHTELLALYHRAQVVVIGLNTHIDTTDSMGTFAVAEAMSMGKPVIVTHTRSLESYIRDGVTGVFVPPHDVAAMRTEIESLLDDPEKRGRMGVAARSFVVTHAHADLFAKNLSGFFSRIMSET